MRGFLCPVVRSSGVQASILGSALILPFMKFYFHSCSFSPDNARVLQVVQMKLTVLHRARD